jgi:hypothetical protein
MSLSNQEYWLRFDIGESVGGLLRRSSGVQVIAVWIRLGQQ